jgi:hypothetical protein
MRSRFLLPRQVREEGEKNGTQVMMCGWSASHKRSQRLRQGGEPCLCEGSASSDETARLLLAMPRVAGREPQKRVTSKTAGQAPVLATGRFGCDGADRSGQQSLSSPAQDHGGGGAAGCTRPGGGAVERAIAAAHRRDAPGGVGEDQTLESVSRLAGVCQIRVRKDAAIRWQGTPTVEWWS